jgi:hypothetical protein
MLRLFVLFTSLRLTFALPSPQAAPLDSLIILDTGVGHRSTPVSRWPTSLRSLTTYGTNATTLTQFGAASNATSANEPISAYTLAYSPSTSFLFSATGQGIIRTNVDGSDARVILYENIEDSSDSQIFSITVAEEEKKIYYGTFYSGLIKKADFDGGKVEVVRNISQGLDHTIGPSYIPANFYAGGIVVDEARGWLYWSAVRGDDDGSIRRAPLDGKDEEQILVSGINMPGQLRINGEHFYWAERGRWSTSPTAIKYLDRFLSQLPATPTTPKTPVPTGTLVSSEQSSLFFENDYTGERQTLGIQSFVAYDNGVELTVWFVVESSGRTMFGKLVQVNWRGSGGSRGPVFEILNEDTKEVGVPIGLEYVR